MKLVPAAAAIALAFSATSALAADLPNRKGPPIYVAPVAFSWTSCYAGINVGVGFGNDDRETGSQLLVVAAGSGSAAWSLPNNFDVGIVGGGQLGCNYQFSPWLVVGVEADMQGTNLDTSAVGAAGLATTPGVAPFATNFNSNNFVDWFGTDRVRIGIVPPMFDSRLMLYGTGGFAYGRVTSRFSKVDFNVPTTGSVFGNTVISDVELGWAAGGGVEWAPAMLPNVSVNLDYLFVDLGSRTFVVPGVIQTGAAFGTPSVFTAFDNVPTRFHTVRATVNYHVNLFGPGPIAASF
ncbi:MAG: porin family protein [Methylocystis sp.]|nr:porin family protein [Methylocystis sp.]MBI3275872.1 porin family protein [Methylocystis sp.]